MKNKGTRIGLILIGILLTILSGFLLSIVLKDCDPKPLQIRPTGTESAENQSDMEAITEAETEILTTTVTIIDVGQGSAALLESNGEYAIIDTGSTERAQVPIAILKRLGAEKISLLLNTHWDSDHCGATIGILKNFQVEHFAGAGYETDTKTCQKIQEYITENSILMEVPKPGDTYTVGNCTITIIGPSHYDYEQENNRCISLILSDGKNRVYFGGDTENAGESDLIAGDFNLDCDVYICNHHGSADASSKAFVEALSPACTVISCGKDNEYGHPSKRTLETIHESGSLLYRTDLQGDIIFYLTEQGILFDKEPTEDWTRGIYTKEAE